MDSSASPDPNAPSRKLSHEVILWGGFGLCLLVALLTVVLPELSGADARDASSRSSATGEQGAKKPAPAPAPAP